jgi:transposase
MIISPARDNGRKRHLVTDTLGLLLVVVVTSASAQDRHGGRQILAGLVGDSRQERVNWEDRDTLLICVTRSGSSVGRVRLRHQ